MARRKYERKSFASKFLGRLTRAFFSILILTAFVLGIAYFVKQAQGLSPEKIVSMSSPYLSKLGFSVDKEKVGDVAGEFIKRATDVGIENRDEEGLSKRNSENSAQVSGSEQGDVLDSASTSRTKENALFSVALIADSHIAKGPEYEDNDEQLERALRAAEELGAETAIHVGDITNLGVQNDLETAEEIMIDSDLVYYALPGDRDLWASPTESPFEYFLNVFGQANREFTLEGYKFVMFNNSANYTPLPEEDLVWFENQIQDADFVILSQPLYTDGLGVPRDEMYMGSTLEDSSGSQEDSQQQVLEQRNRMLSAVRESDVQAVIAGDHHYPSRLKDSVRNDLTHYVLGAVSEATGEYSDFASLLNIQPEFSILTIFEDGTYLVESVVLE